MAVDREGNAHPVERTRAVASHQAAVFHVLQHFGSGQERFAGADEIVGQSPAQLFGGGRGILLVDEIREGQQIGGGIVERDVKIASIHQLLKDAVHGGEKLLQVMSGTAFFGDPIEC
jgi:hypothetical protein